MFPAFRTWDASSLPSTGSDHAPIVISLRPPTPHNDRPRPRWEEADWPGLTDKLKNWLVPPPPESPSPNQLDQWFSSALAALTATIETTAPRSRPSPKSKAWWTPLLTALRKEFAKASRKAKKTQTPDSYHIARQSRLGYFKAIKRAKASYWADFLAKTSPNNIWTAKQLVAPRKTPRFPSLPDASNPVAINKALLDHFFPPKDPLPSRGRLKRNPTAKPLTEEEIKLALSKSSPSSAPGPDGIPYSVWKRVNLINPAILLELLSPLVAFGYHPPSLKIANGVVLDKPGKASYDSPASFRIIVLLKTVSKILERAMAVRLSAIARSKGLLHPNQCGSLPGLSSSDACLTLMHEVKTLQRPRLKVSTLFLDIKAGFDNVNASTLRARLLASSVPSYMVDWVSSFLSERTCTLVFQGSPNISSPVSVGTPQGSPISPLLFLLYVAPLHMSIPRGLMVSYVDDFSVTVASPSYRGNIRRLQNLFSNITTKGRDIGVSFSVPKTELIHWRTHSQRTPPSHAPIELEDHLFRPAQAVRWLGYWFTPSFNTTHHYRHRLSLAQAIFSFVKRLSSPGAGVKPFLCHRLAGGLLLPILTYGADLLTPNYAALRGMNSFWHRVQRWTTNSFYSTPTSILSREACLPPIISYCRYRRRLAALRIACAPPSANPASARLPQSFPSLSSFRAQDASRHLTIGLSSVYLPLNWRTRVPSPPVRKHLPVDALAHLTLPLQEGLTRLPLVLHAPPPPGTEIPPPDLMRKTYQALRTRARNMLIQDWITDDPTPPYYGYPPTLSPHPFMGLGKFVAGRIHQMRSGKSYLAAHPSWSDEEADPTCPRCEVGPESFQHAILTCPARQQARDLLLKDVSSLAHDATTWTDPLLIRALGEYITDTRTGFPPDMLPDHLFPPPSPFPPS